MYSWPHDGLEIESQQDLIDHFHADPSFTLLSTSDTGLVAITEDGATTLKLRPHPGGWAEYGERDAEHFPCDPQDVGDADG